MRAPHLILPLAALLTIFLWTPVGAEAGDKPEPTAPTQEIAETRASPDDWQLFHLSALMQERSDSGRPYLPFFQNPSLRLGLYELEVGAVDRQRPHEVDEIYYVLEGLATAIVGEQRQPVRAGDVLFVAAQVPHQFVEIRETLRLLVVFSSQKPPISSTEASEASMASE